jgi:peptidoglycan/xylan/chitin deacetylase (PgdA/CDA1 family)
MLGADLIVLCYHAVSPTWPAALSVSPVVLRRQLSRLVQRGYRGATFTKAVLEPSREPTVCVTFDDAYASVLAKGLPVLDEFGLPGTVFAASSFIGRDEPMAWPGIDGWLETQHSKELLPMSWADLALLREHGWEVGSHTRTHPRLTRLNDEELGRELRDSKLELESGLGAVCTSLAYPYGDHDARVVQAARRAGYVAAGTLPTTFPAAKELAWPRVGVYHEDGAVIFALNTSRIVRSLRRGAGWNLAQRAIRAVR